jgi:outer membrane protein OmpA-like peptidoglycan-associated protein
MSFSLAACKPKTTEPHPDAASATAVAPPEPKAAGAAPNKGSAPASQPQFDIEKVPVSNGVLPPFPYLEYPPGISEGGRFTNKANFDSLYVVTGKQLRKVEGRVESHEFYLNATRMSEAEARRNYENLIAQMGGVKVNDATPSELASSSEELSANKKKTRFTDGTMTYDAYLVRKPDQLVWIVLMANNSSVITLVVAEQPFKQTVAFVTADAMQSQLASAGHVALYINFDTDKAAIRPDGRPAVDEIAKLLEKDPSLKLTIEGHTDNVGDPAHNKALSQQRADAVMGSLIAAGIAKERLSTAGLGDTRPVADNKDETGRARNRRVELVKRT